MGVKSDHFSGERAMTNGNARYWIEKLQLEPHPEGGYFRQTYRSEVVIAREALPAGFSGARAVSTAIYFLLEGKNFSAFHRLRSDEVWHFYAGEPLVVHVIEPEGKLFPDSSRTRSGRRGRFCRRWCGRGAGSRRMSRIGSLFRSSDARWRRDLILRTSRWGSGKSWARCIRSIGS